MEISSRHSKIRHIFYNNNESVLAWAASAAASETEREDLSNANEALTTPASLLTMKPAAIKQACGYPAVKKELIKNLTARQAWGSLGKKSTALMP